MLTENRIDNESAKHLTQWIMKRTKRSAFKVKAVNVNNKSKADSLKKCF